jgi:hypothetical protein
MCQQQQQQQEQQINPVEVSLVILKHATPWAGFHRKTSPQSFRIDESTAYREFCNGARGRRTRQQIADFTEVAPSRWRRS